MHNSGLPLQPEHLAAVLDSVADGVFTVDTQLLITWMNRAAERITGFSRQEAVGQPCCEIFRTDICFSDCPVRQAMNQQADVLERRVNILDRFNREVPISISAAVLEDDQGQICGGVETLRDLSRIQALEKAVKGQEGFCGMLSRNRRMQELFRVMPQVAESEATVLIQGESGTGKELVARALHDLSPRQQGPLVVLNCGAMPEQLLEAELFGVKRGAYTGAVSDRQGRLAQAEGGTLFLDEIGDLPLPLQVKLLRVLENGEYQALGASRSQQANVRFVAATHQDLADMVAQGSFRRDLYHRIHVVNLQLPPLRQRPEDVPLLLEAALEQASGRYNRRVRGFTAEALQVLLEYPYYGNVRELFNVVERAVILASGEWIDKQQLPQLEYGSHEGLAASLHFHAKRPSAAYLQQVMQGCRNRQEAARQLGVNRSTLWRWLKHYGLQ